MWVWCNNSRGHTHCSCRIPRHIGGWGNSRSSRIVMNMVMVVVVVMMV